MQAGQLFGPLHWHQCQATMMLLSVPQQPSMRMLNQLQTPPTTFMAAALSHGGSACHKLHGDCAVFG